MWRRQGRGVKASSSRVGPRPALLHPRESTGQGDPGGPVTRPAGLLTAAQLTGGMGERRDGAWGLGRVRRATQGQGV